MPKNSLDTKIWTNARLAETASVEEYNEYTAILKSKLDSFYSRSLAYRLGKLTSSELKRIKVKAEKAKELANTLKDVSLRYSANKVLNRLTITRENALLFDIEYETAKLTNLLIDTVDDLLIENTETSFEAAVVIGNNTLSTSKDVNLSNKEAKNIKNHKYPGAKFDEFLKDRKNKLFRDIQKSLVSNIRTKSSLTKLVTKIKKLVKMQKNYTKTLIRNQVSFVSNLAAKEAYSKLGFEKYRYNAILDSKTTAVCRGLHGTVHNLSDGVPGVNMPPMSDPIHPCRSYITPEKEQ